VDTEPPHALNIGGQSLAHALGAMAIFTTEGARSGDGVTSTSENGGLRGVEGQRHYRISDEVPLSATPIGPLPGRDDNGEIGITAGQKMLSAMSGSLLTSLIGTFSIYGAVR
jgi:hypothetical protein